MPRVRESAVLGADGRKVLIVEPPYRSAGGGRRFVGFQAPDVGPNAALLGSLDLLRARSRALYRNNALIWHAIETLVANYIGWGATPKSEAEGEATQQAIDGTWADWARQVCFDTKQTEATREALLAGEVFVRIRNRYPSDEDALGRRLVVPLDLQLLEAEHCPTWKTETLATGNRIRAGIEFDAIGRRVAYWMYREHPGDLAPFRDGRELELVRVPATEVIHIYVRESPGQIRGVPRLARVLLKSHDLEAFDDAALQRAAIAVLFAGFIRKPDGAAGVVGESDELPEPTLEPGTLSYLGDGEDITFPSLPDVGANYQPFIKAMHQILAAGVGLTVEQFDGDLSGVNYSSIRAGALEFRRSCQMWQWATLTAQFLEPVWVRFLRRAVLGGALAIPGFRENELTASRVEWIFQGWEWVDPLKEVAAAEKEVLAGFSTRREVNMRRGNDPERIERERAAEVQRAEALGLRFSTDVAEPAPAAPAADGGAAASTDETDGAAYG